MIQIVEAVSHNDEIAYFCPGCGELIHLMGIKNKDDRIYGVSRAIIVKNYEHWYMPDSCVEKHDVHFVVHWKDG